MGMFIDFLNATAKNIDEGIRIAAGKIGPDDPITPCHTTDFC